MERMSRFIYILLGTFFSASVISQERIILKDNAFIVLQNSAQLVIENNATNAITTFGAGGNIISESEFNNVKWNIGVSTGIYTIPFSKSIGNKIPLILNITTPGVLPGSILFSTYGGSWDNATYLPSEVTSFEAVCCANNSANVIDRFWIINSINYTTKPEVDITFTYLDSEVNAASNTIDEAILVAQRYSTVASVHWGDWLGTVGTADVAANTVSSGSVAPSDFFKSWTLSNLASPLPIELLDFELSCKDDITITFEWKTASEMNNNFFTIEKSSDALSWESVATIPSENSNSSVVQRYFYELALKGLNKHDDVFFRLKQTDFDLNATYSKIIINSCDKQQLEEFVIYPNPSSTKFTLDYSENNTPIDVSICDLHGRVLTRQVVSTEMKTPSLVFDLSGKSPGIYYLLVNTGDKVVAKKIIHQ